MINAPRLSRTNSVAGLSKQELYNIATRNATNEKYFVITDERRKRFHELMDSQDQYKFSKPQISRVGYEIDDEKFQCTFTIKKCKTIKGEPTLWFMETIMPSDPSHFREYFGDLEHRLNWDKTINQFDTKVLFQIANGDMMGITNALSDKYMGGAISPRQFTSVVHSKTIDKKTIESVSCTIDHEAFPVKKGYVKAWSTLYGFRMTEIESDELKEKYKIPELKCKDGDVAIKWCKCESMWQATIGGNVPTMVIDKGTMKATNDIFKACRQYVLQNVMGFDVKIVIPSLFSKLSW